MLVGLLAGLALTLGRQDAPPQPLSAVPALVDYPAPDLRLDTLDGKSTSLKNYAGQVVLVNLWAVWCPPCKAEMPVLQAYYQTHHEQGFTLIAINAGDTQEQVRAFVTGNGLTFPVWLDPDGAASRAFRSMGLPSSYVVDRSGRVRLAWSGAVERETLETYVTPLIVE